jgi:glycosyltransferase involved in cell wall biosynthesis
VTTLSVIIVGSWDAHDPTALEHVIADLARHRSATDLAMDMEVIAVAPGCEAEQPPNDAMGREDAVRLVRIIGVAGTSPAHAWNRGVRESDGDLVAFLGSDARWTPAFLDVLVRAAIGESATDITQGRAERPGNDGCDVDTAVFRRHVFDRVGPFDESLTHLAGYDWFLRAFDARIAKTRLEVDVLGPGLVAAEHPGHGRRRNDGQGPIALGGRAPVSSEFVRVHRSSRRRRAAGLAPVPPGFPAPSDYIGTAPDGVIAAQTGLGRSLTHLVVPVDEMSIPGLERIQGDSRSVPAGGVVAFMCVRNEGSRIQAWLRHHRRLGIDRFVVIDNASTDGTSHELLAHPDVILYRTAESFAASNFGTDWILALMRRHASDRWCLVADADELFIHPGYEEGSLPRWCRSLEREGADAVLAPMIDLYPQGPLRDASLAPGSDPLATFRWFDFPAWHLEQAAFAGHTAHPSLFGGVRQRVFGSPNDDQHYYVLNKVPLLRCREGIRLSPSFHWIDGAVLSGARAALLHWKCTPRLAEHARSEVSRAQHWGAGSQYMRYLQSLDADPSMSLFDPDRSMEFRSGEQLVELGIMRHITDRSGARS